MIDVHCHLNFRSFETDINSVINKAREKGVSKIINTGTKIDSSQKAIALADKNEDLFAIVGIHPHHADKLEDDWEQQLEELARKPKVVGIGECGLDYYSYRSNGVVDIEKQREVFEKQIVLSHKVKLPLQIHNRHAGEDVIKILKHYKKYLLDTPGMFHCFAGSKTVLNEALTLGFYIGFDGNITYKGLAPGESVSLPELVSLTPLDRILTETDSPFLTPQPFRGSRNEPLYVILVGEFIAKIKGIPVDQVEKATEKNARAVFAIS